MSEKNFKPYVPADSNLPEFTFPAVALGVGLAVILGAANAWLGMKAGQTIAATFPAAVVAMAALRLTKGNILQENIARTAASVGEALVAGAIFTVPAFVMVGYWDNLLTVSAYMEGTALLLVGGVLGVLFVILLRRTLVAEADLPFPESLAAAEIHKAGQKGATGAGYVFGAMGLSMLVELFKNDGGIKLFKEYVGGFWTFTQSKVPILSQKLGFGGGILYRTPAASPALIGVGYVIGPRLSAITFSGGVFAWGLLIPLVLFMNGAGGDFARLSGGTEAGWVGLATDAWLNIVRPLAVGAMLVGSLYTLYTLRKQLIGGVGKAIADLKEFGAGGGSGGSRLEKDLSIKTILIWVVLMIIPVTALYYYFSGSFEGALIAALVMTVAGFLFAAVAGYLVGVIGSSSNPISGLTLTTVLIAALLMKALGVASGGASVAAIAAVLGVAAVVCCACGIAGDMMQDLKVGHILGGTPWKMELAEIISVVLVSFVLILPIGLLHQSDIAIGGQGIGGEALPAPQAGLMAMLSKGIVSGEMAWPLVIVGMAFSIGLILIKAPSPMLIAVGMYLPLQTTFAIFVGGVIRALLDVVMARRKLSEDDSTRASNTGLLVASGLIAGEALTGVILAMMILGRSKFPWLEFPHIIEDGSGWLSLIIFGVVTWALIALPLGSLKKKDASA
ncbi:MAG TPA: oligopeptide transporter, OPT family [Candidatus Saccharimonadales bacterium]|nr:oligopeptide transporter, OPT family [Candidatus Saccharimonadales bacterium]